MGRKDTQHTTRRNELTTPHRGLLTYRYYTILITYCYTILPLSGYVTIIRELSLSPPYLCPRPSRHYAILSVTVSRILQHYPSSPLVLRAYTAQTAPTASQHFNIQYYYTIIQQQRASLSHYYTIILFYYYIAPSLSPHYHINIYILFQTDNDRRASVYR